MSVMQFMRVYWYIDTFVSKIRKLAPTQNCRPSNDINPKRSLGSVCDAPKNSKVKRPTRHLMPVHPSIGTLKCSIVWLNHQALPALPFSWGCSLDSLSSPCYRFSIAGRHGQRHYLDQDLVRRLEIVHLHSRHHC
jgi:hypothetical protein